jgi:competence protein ComEA
MTADKVSKLWLLATGFLIIIIIVSGIIIWTRQGGSQEISIVPSQTSDFKGDIYVYGAVANPGIYPLKTGDSIESLIQTSGGANTNANLSCINLYVPETSTSIPQPQKININRADAWLLEALPDIGASRASDIIAYRQQNGLFRNIDEITNVPGISLATFEKIKNLITVAE